MVYDFPLTDLFGSTFHPLFIVVVDDIGNIVDNNGCQERFRFNTGPDDDDDDVVVLLVLVVDCDNTL